ncbi:uncharacterized protein (DUF302 family) [Litoreibacter halocynthiae]|uniref:Uncharacterized protein (DUF302 family) n=1 Tax=Litoreibacter halocynthiae TaxID=1242689 RepID=A0A4R7LRM5_9RHOB|nr:DUF302 domain-containing protein [Litoreibacter halocynthiae]TDT77161.1 uncharacterized protein (DUF302 family) [Litoreibacter halocynthiae]
MRQIALSMALLASVAMPASADLITVKSSKPVAETMDALEAAVGNAGATVFARVDHQAGATGVDLQMPAAQVLIFGNPKLGTPAMNADIRASLYLPLKIAVHEANGGSVLVYEDPADTFGDLNIPEDAPFVKTMQGALGKLTGAAVK